jgi:hypothetical protein
LDGTDALRTHSGWFDSSRGHHFDGSVGHRVTREQPTMQLGAS